MTHGFLLFLVFCFVMGILLAAGFGWLAWTLFTRVAGKPKTQQVLMVLSGVLASLGFVLFAGCVGGGLDELSRMIFPHKNRYNQQMEHEEMRSLQQAREQRLSGTSATAPAMDQTPIPVESSGSVSATSVP
jgi:hypothetical protein